MSLQHPDLMGKRVAVLGYGREGQATLAYLRQYHPEASVTVLDRNPEVEIEGCPSVTGDRYLDNLAAFDLILKSPGIPPSPELNAVADRVTSATRLFWDIIAPTGAMVVGVTGTKGKSTVSSLIHHLLTQAGKQSVLVGNVGEPVLAHLEEASERTIFVQELSSYQLADVTSSPPIAVLTSFFPEHLDYHGSVENYFVAKQRIVRFQKPGDRVFYPAGNAECARLAAASAGEQIAVPVNPAFAAAATSLIGQHNAQNVALTVEVARYLGADETTFSQALGTFKALPHRLELLEDKNGIRWTDDAISTTPESTAAALEALEGQVDTLIAGGMNRGYRFDELAEKILATGVRNVIIFPDSGPVLADALREAAAAYPTNELNIESASDMVTAVQMADAMTAAGKMCLLSPASPSYNMFKNFEDRGNQFAAAVRNLPVR